MNKKLEYYLKLHYKINIEYVKEDNSWFAYCPELGKGACYAIGGSPEEALKLLEAEKKDLIQLLLEEGKTVPLPKETNEDELPSGQFVVRLSRTLHLKIKNDAEKENISVNQFVTSVLAEKVGELNVLYKLKKELVQLQFEALKQFHWFIPNIKDSFSQSVDFEIRDKEKSSTYYEQGVEYNGYESGRFSKEN